MAEIHFNGRVDQQNVDRLIQEVENFINQGELNVLVHFDSAGGNVTEGIRGYDALVVHQNKLTMNNLNRAHSAAGLIFCSGAIRICNSNASFLIHSTSSTYIGGQNPTPQQLQTHNNSVIQINGVQAKIIHDTTGTQIRTILRWIYTRPNGNTLTSQQALTHNLVQTINATPIIPAAGAVSIP